MTTPIVTQPVTADIRNAHVDRRFTARQFGLESGVVLPEVTIAFETYGRLAADGTNAIS